MRSKGASYGAFDAIKRWGASIERHLLLRVCLIRRILSALSINP
ncbi:MAG TPA: hypothetical protein VLW86_04025 [Syntrophorhabdales bacterium]|nr:hypothetical protein [Syntrophorhabdales bacterium]